MRSFGKSNRSPGAARGDAKIRNVGPRSAAWLRQVGVRTRDDLLAQGGALPVFLRARKAGFKVTLNLLYALAGAEDDCHWQDLGEARREALLAALREAEASDPKLAPKRGGRSQAGSGLGAALVEKALGPSEPALPED